ncbi:MAG TPA: hypothetical protein GX708_20555 [Gallicola sp.]|nr:hypothetical protein [Gallicola sp.]
MKDNKILETRVYIDQNEIHYAITAENGSTYELKDLDDGYLIDVLKEKGYKITKEF